MDEVLGRERPQLLSRQVNGLGALAVEGLTRRYENAERAAVDGVSFAVAAGELLALVGASGSGKTTTLRMIAGYERPDAGRVRLRGADGEERDITFDPPQRRGFGMVFQHYALFPHMSVAENVAFGLEARGTARRDRLRRADEALARVGLAGTGGRAVQSLSGGEQQRVALARALVIEPPVLLLDEPLSNLDPRLRQTTRDQLRAMLHGLHVTAVFVTHDQEDAFAVADRVAMLHRGKLLQIATPEELYDRPATGEVAAFIGRSTLAPARRDGDRAAVTLAGVTQHAPVACTEHATTGEMRAVLRPESLELVDAGTPGSWRGRIESRRFAGGHFSYCVVLADGTSVEIAATNGAVPEGSETGVRLRRRPVALVAG